jgi:hypothetical protein
VLGVFLLFCVPIGGGIPFGVLMARGAGVPPLATVALYFASDLILAITTEPLLALLRWLSARIEMLARIGAAFARLSGSAGLQEPGMRGPLGLILVAFSVSPTTGRAAAAAAGHGFVSGWTLAIVGDMGYFLVLMVTTLWVSSVVGDDRFTIGAVLIGTWVLPLIIRRLRRRRSVPASSPTPVPSVATLVPTGAATDVATSAPRAARKRSPPAARRRSTRGLHR